ncbi:M55 family metallopeptidase [Arthrobacter sp. B2a2-09]|uniref:M55 family metallopeptidase n=1 Tax=Arthrobacter sp. B2a2-09 TaxID=2952822 RepID=UPI0022CD9EC0|nr:M55 family metallopeptidase [Arthrobacter sp. B2a2-09]MCZ9883191.1 M55 family metallopeptidase [Arthrobacter sp. B2a2-09]
MKVYISVDMEGISGVATYDQIIRGGTGYPRAQALMTAETNAAVEGAFEGGATEVLVNDSHGTMNNLLHEDLDPRARVIFGNPTAFCMAEGLTPDFDVAFYIGYHAPAGVEGLLAHSFSGLFTSFKLNGEIASEASINALFAATRGVPVGLVTGDNVICDIAEREFPGVLTVPVKVAHGFQAANSLSPTYARAAIRKSARAAVQGVEKTRLLPVPDQLRLEIGFQNPLAAELLEAVPGVSRVSNLVIAREVESAEELLGMIGTTYELAAVAAKTMFLRESLR